MSVKELLSSDTSIAPSLPRPRGELSEWLLGTLCSDPGPVVGPDRRAIELAGEEDSALSLYCCYELHYGGLAGVSEDWEWEPSLLGFRRLLEDRLEEELRDMAGPVSVRPEAVVEGLYDLVHSSSGPSLSRFLMEEGTRHHLRELAVHRSAYQLKEADPHTWAVPRLRGEAKATLFAIQFGEYGEGDAEAMHSQLFAEAMSSLGLDPAPNAYLDSIPARSLRTTNLISLFGLHRRLRGALVGHLALFEMTSVGPMERSLAALRRLEVPPAGQRFYQVHIEADVLHEKLAVSGLVGGFLEEEPEMASDVLFGAKCLQEAERSMAEALIGAWRAGKSSLLRPLEDIDPAQEG